MILYMLKYMHCTGPSQPMRPPTEASRTSGSAAIARLEGQQNQRKPLSGNSQPMKKKERDSGGQVQSSHSGGGVSKDWPQGGKRLDSQVSMDDLIHTHTHTHTNSITYMSCIYYMYTHFPYGTDEANFLMYNVCIIYYFQPSQPSPSSSSERQHDQEPVVSVVDVSSRIVIVHMVCPVCKRSTPHSTLREHFAACLQEVRT